MKVKASLDTNIVAQADAAKCLDGLFNFFDKNEGLVLYYKLRDIELENHWDVNPDGNLLRNVDECILDNRITLYTDEKLRENHQYYKFCESFNKYYKNFSEKDIGEVWAIALAKAVGADILLTNDTKKGGPYHQLYQFDESLRPMNLPELLFLRYLKGDYNATDTIANYLRINENGTTTWKFEQNLKLFKNRFLLDPPMDFERKFMDNFINEYQISDVNRMLDILYNRYQKFKSIPINGLGEKDIKRYLKTNNENVKYFLLKYGIDIPYDQPSSNLVKNEIPNQSLNDSFMGNRLSSCKGFDKLFIQHNEPEIPENQEESPNELNTGNSFSLADCKKRVRSSNEQFQVSPNNTIENSLVQNKQVENSGFPCKEESFYVSGKDEGFTLGQISKRLNEIYPHTLNNSVNTKKSDKKQNSGFSR